MSQADIAIFLANCCHSHNFLSSFMGSYRPTAQLLSMILNMLTRNEREVMPLLLGLHIMDDGGCLNIQTSNASLSAKESVTAEESHDRNTGGTPL